MTLTAVLLAGGESRRMGTEKATIVFNGEPLWLRQIKLLRYLEPEEILVSARAERSWRPPDTELVLDQTPSRGPISGLTAALARTRTSHLVALGVDMPFVTAAQLRDLCHRHWKLHQSQPMGVCLLPKVFLLQGWREVFNDDFIETFLRRLIPHMGREYGQFDSRKFSFRFHAIEEDGVCMSRIVTSVQDDCFHLR